MKIELKSITVRELVENYLDNPEDGSVVGYGGRLDIRPPYQREFIYKDNQRNAVINTLTKGFPLNVMYWAVREDGTYEVIDGQQRTISICQYVQGDYSVVLGNFPQPRAFHNLQDSEQQQILDYQLTVYFCSGTDIEKLEWFKTINIAGVQLKEQELRNAVYCGSWVSDAKKYFSKKKCPAYGLGSDYINGALDRQDYLETAIRWISNDNINAYMAAHQHDPNASALWRYFQSVITWVQQTFVEKREKFMKGVDWGFLYNDYKDVVYDTAQLEAETARLMLDDDVTNKKGIYPYLLTGKERYLSIRTFTDAIKQAAYERQQGICPHCGNHFELSQMEGDHITPWHAGGKTTAENCQMLCKDCNRRKSGK